MNHPGLPPRNVDLFLVAVAGACSGCFCALVLVDLAFYLKPTPARINLLFYFFSFLLGLAGGWMFVRRFPACPRFPPATAAGFLGWLLLFSWALQQTFDAHKPANNPARNEWLLWPGLLTGITLLGLLKFGWTSRGASAHPASGSRLSCGLPLGQNQEKVRTCPPPNLSIEKIGGFIRAHILAWLGLTVLLWPYPLTGPAPAPYNFHRVSFCIAPALYQFGDGLLPGPDLFSQYGAGQGFFFSFFLADTALKTVNNFYLLFLACNLIFFLLAYHFLTWLLNSRGWAFGVCLLTLLGQFYSHGGGVMFSVTPSIGVYRILPIIPATWVFARLCRQNFPSSLALVSGMVLGLTLFWQTDIGVAFLAASLCSLFALSFSVRRTLITAVVLLLATAVTFGTLSGLAYGQGAWRFRYLHGLLAPWFWYTGGELSFNFFPWELDNYFYFPLFGLVCSASAISYIAMVWRHSHHGLSLKSSSLVFLSFLSLFLHAKYAVRPISVYWTGTGLASFTVMAWSLKKFLPLVLHGLSLGGGQVIVPARMGGSVLHVLAAVIGLVCGGFLGSGSGQPLHENGWQSYRHYNSLFNVGVQEGLGFVGIGKGWEPPPTPEFFRNHGMDVDLFSAPDLDQEIVKTTPADTELIRNNTAPGERTAIFSWYDWAFLLEAQRPPKYFMLPVPSMMQFTTLFKDMLEETRESQVLFIDKRCQGFLRGGQKEGGWRHSFVPAAESDHLLLFRRLSDRSPSP